MGEEVAVGFHNLESKQILVATIAVVLTGLLISKVAQKLRSPRPLPPGPRGWPLLGSLLSLGVYPHKALFELSKKYGPIMHMHLGSIGTLVISDKVMAKEILQTNDQLFASRPHLLVPAYLTYDRKDLVFSPYGAHWRHARKICNLQLLTATKLTHYSTVISQEIMTAIHSILQTSQSGKVVNMSTTLGALTMNIMTQIMWNRSHRNLSEQSNADNFAEITQACIDVCGANNIADYLPCFKSLALKLSGLEKKARDAHEQFDEFFENILSERERAASSTKTHTQRDADDIVDVLLKLADKSTNSDGPTRDTMKAILGDMMLGGTDTNSVTMDWALAELMANPPLLRKVQDELTAVVGPDRLVNESDIPNLKYLGAVVKETLRRHSPLPMGVPRLSMDNCEVGGYKVPKNTMVFVNYYAIHHDAAVWAKPMQFNPERFLQFEKDYKGHNFDYLPFSSGRRMCPGMNLASVVLHLTLAQFLHTMSLSLPDNLNSWDVDLTEHAGIVISRADPLLLKAKPRLASHIISPAKI